MKPFAAPRTCRGWKAKRCIGIIFFRTFVLRITLMLSRVFSEPLMSVSNKHNYKTFSESLPAFPLYFFFNQLERQATILINRTRTFAWKEPLPIAPPLGKLDNNLSPRVGDFAQKIIPDLNCPGGTLGDTLDTSIMGNIVIQIREKFQVLYLFDMPRFIKLMTKNIEVWFIMSSNNS